MVCWVCLVVKNVCFKYFYVGANMRVFPLFGFGVVLFGPQRKGEGVIFVCVVCFVYSVISLLLLSVFVWLLARFPISPNAHTCKRKPNVPYIEDICLEWRIKYDFERYFPIVVSELIHLTHLYCVKKLRLKHLISSNPWEINCLALETKKQNLSLFLLTQLIKPTIGNNAIFK
jgi:hypothetical protein